MKKSSAPLSSAKPIDIRMRDLDSYDSRYRGNPQEAQSAAVRRRHALQTMRAHPHRRILEVGCGTAPLFLDFAAYDKMTVVEPTAGFYQTARRLMKKIAPSRAAKIELINAYMEEAHDALKNHRFDFVFVAGLLHEVPDPAALMRAVRRVMPAQAVAYVSAPNALSFHRLLAVEMRLIKSVHETSPMQKALQQPRIFDVHSLRRLMKDTGFKVLSEGTFHIKPFTDAQMTTLKKSGILTDAMQQGLEKMSRHLPDFGANVYVTVSPR